LLPGEVVETGAITTIKLENGGTARSAVATQAADKGLKVKIGVRPEDYVETTGEAIHAGEVDFTEALGEVTLLYFRKDGDAAAMVAKLPGIRAELRRTTVKLTADPKKVHLFAGGKSLLYR
ncbi:MAG: ABC transporter ATP-binding protein, partial [Rhodobacterales bacterium]|nr:ABC transporter ATP-binding protein [Rhodobacterales bacterium]